MEAIEMPSEVAERVETIDPNRIREERILPLDGAGATARAHSRDVGERIEDYICELYDLTPERSTHYDALATSRIPIQIKGAAWRVRNGTNQNGTQKWLAGRFRLYESDHYWLVENGGLYACCVYQEAAGGLRPVFTRLVPADYMDEWFVDDEQWYDLASLDRKREGSAYRLPWPRLWPTKGGIT